MTNTESTTAAATAQQTIDRISVHQRSGIWRVEINGRFYGDYTRRYWALESAFDKADDIAESGGAAIIMWTIDGQQDALLYDTRHPARRKNAKRVVEWPRTRRWPPIVGESFARRLLEQAQR